MKEVLPSVKHTLFSKVNTYSLIFSIITIAFLSIMRFTTLYFFGDPADIQNNYPVLDDLFILGLRFDLRIIGIVLLLFVYLPYLFLFWLKNDSLYIGWIKFSLSFSLSSIVFLAFIDIGYFVFFGTPIDILIFGLFEDDTLAVIKSGVANPRLILISIIAPIVILALILVFLKYSKTLSLIDSIRIIPQKPWLIIFLLPLLLLAARGSVGTFPLTLKQSSISNNSFINSLTQNAIFHLKYALDNRKENNFNKSSKEILSEAKVKNIDELIDKAGYSSFQPLIRNTAKNNLLEKKPPHVIFVLMEGWSSHIALNDSEDIPVLGSFRKHAKQDYFLPYFFSNQFGTNPSIENILLNTPLTPLSQSSGYKTSFSLSNITPFKKNGYSTTFYSGGYSSWRNHDIFWPKQGFDEYIGRTTIEDKYQLKADNPWGTYDEYVFKYLKEALVKKENPSFSFVLTTNNHPPVHLPADYIPPKFKVQAMGFKDNTEQKSIALSGYHYQTNALGDFLDWLKKSDLSNDVIVIATGDHPLRGFDDYTGVKKQFLRYGVPAYFYIPEQYDQFKMLPKQELENFYGSHADIFPTLFELALSETPYYAFGTPVMKKTSDTAYGWNYKDAMILKGGIIDVQNKKLFRWDEKNKLLLKSKSSEISAEQIKIIKQEKYRKWLKEWLLYEDKEQRK